MSSTNLTSRGSNVLYRALDVLGGDASLSSGLLNLIEKFLELLRTRRLERLEDHYVAFVDANEVIPRLQPEALERSKAACQGPAG